MINAVAANWRGTAPCSAEDGPSEHESTKDPCPPRHLSVVGRDGFTRTETDVSPPRHGRREDDDATKLSVPILIVIAMLVSGVTASISASGVYWMLRMSNREAQYEMQADIRSIREGLSSQARVDEADKRAAAAELKSQMQSYESTKQSVDAMRGIVQLLQLQMAELLKQRKP